MMEVNRAIGPPGGGIHGWMLGTADSADAIRPPRDANAVDKSPLVFTLILLHLTFSVKYETDKDSHLDIVRRMTGKLEIALAARTIRG